MNESDEALVQGHSEVYEYITKCNDKDKREALCNRIISDLSKSTTKDHVYILAALGHCKYENNDNVDIVKCAEALESAENTEFIFTEIQNNHFYSTISAVTFIVSLRLTNEKKNRQFRDSWWPIIIPFLLRLFESTKTEDRLKCVNVVHYLVENQADKLINSGLSPLFEQKIEPFIHFLPPLSAPEETMRVFKPSLMCLAELADISIKPTESTEAIVKSTAGNKQTSKDAILYKRNSRLNYLTREGVLKAFLHADGSDLNVELTIYLLNTLEEFIHKHLKSLTIVHLKGITMVFTHILMNPFIDASPELISHTCRMMTVCIQHAWPRIHAYKYNIILALYKSKALTDEWCDLLQLTDSEKVSILQKFTAS